MARQPGTDRIRYGNGNNSVLRLILYNLWKHRCYWCQRPKDFNEVQIDHILPKHAGAKRLDELRTVYGLAEDFDIDDPQNLAPICSACNGQRGKGKKEYGPVPMLMGLLQRARALRPTVIDQVARFGNSGRVADHLLRAAEADLADPNVRQAFAEHAPAVVQKLAFLDAEKADFVSFRTVTVAPYLGLLEVGVSLDGRGRTAAAFLKDVCDCAVEEVIEDRVVKMVEGIRQDVQAEFATAEGLTEPTTVGTAEYHFMRVDIDSLNYERAGSSMEFVFRGTFDMSLTASIVQDSWDGSGLSDVQGDADISGTFSFVATWELTTASGDLESGDYELESSNLDIYTSSRADRADRPKRT